MSTPEERLRALLHSEPVEVGEDGLARIQARVVRRKRTRRLLLPSAVLAVTGMAAGVFVLSDNDARTRLTVVPGVTPTTSPTAGPTTEPTSSTDVYSGPTLLAYTSADKDDVVRHWLALVGIDAVPQRHTCESCDVVPLGVGGKAIGDAYLARYVDQGRTLYVLSSVEAPGMRVTAPVEGASVTSPLTVTGTLDQGVDENVRLALVTESGKEVGGGSAPAGSAVPWRGTLSWSDTSWTHGAVVGRTFSAKDGSLTRLFAIPVTRATGTAATFAGLVDGHVALLDAASGKVVRQLTFPPVGTSDTGGAWNGSSLVWVRSGQTGCRDELDRLDAGVATTLVPAGAAHLSTPQLSPDGGTVAYVRTPCDGSAAQVVVRAEGRSGRTISLRMSSTQVADVRDDGTVLLNERGGSDYRTLVVLPPTATTFSDGRPLALAASCTTIGAAFDGATATTLGWESCADGVRLARFDDGGYRIDAGPLLPTKAYAEDVTVRDGVVLAWLYDGTDLGRIVRVTGGSFTVLVANTGCTSGAHPSRCVRAPDW